VQRLTRRGLARLARTVTTLARAEGLGAHASSIDVRLNDRVPGPQQRKGSTR
jgi:histidinol dehydrogenase